jgi:hypothetical protein
MSKNISKAKKTTKRANKSKEELKDIMRKQEQLAHNKALAKLIWPIISGLPTIYDAQTAVNAAAGFIEAGLNAKVEKITVGELPLDATKGKDSDIERSVRALVELCQSEPADNAMQLLKLFGNHFTGYSAREYLKNKMDVIKMDDFIA